MANFTNGEGSATDGFLGSPGDGWVQAWTKVDTDTASFSSAGVVSATPLSTGGGNYLKATLKTNPNKSNGSGAYVRQYTSIGDISTAARHKIEFKYRFDSPLTTFTNLNDGFFAFGGTGGTVGPDSTSTWVARVFGANNGNAVAQKWAFQNGTAFVDTAVPLVPSTVYSFTIIADPANSQYAATISDGQSGSGHSFTASGLSFRSTSTTNDHVMFGTATNAATESGTFSLDSILITQAPPLAPTGLSASPVSTTQIDLSWTDAANNETGYEVERSSDQSNWTLLTTTAVNATSYSNTTVTDGTRWYYRVRGINAVGQSNWATADAVTPLGAPVNLAGEATETDTVTLDWQDTSSSEYGFEVAMQTGGVGDFVEIANSSQLGPDASLLVVPELELGETYAFKIRAVNGIQNSTWTAPEALRIIHAPAIFAVTDIGDSSVRLHWSHPSGIAALYQVWVGPDGQPNFQHFTNLTGTALAATEDGISATVTGLPFDTELSFGLRAIGTASEQSPLSGSIRARTLPEGTVGEVAALTSVGGPQVQLRWVPSGANIAGYRVYRSADGQAFTLVATLGASTSSWSDPTSLAEGQRFYYRVRAYTAQTELSPVEISTVTRIPAPTNLGATANGATSIDLIWMDNASGETGYEIWAASSRGALTLLEIIPAHAQQGSMTRTVQNLEPDANYVFQVRAVTDEQASEFSPSAGPTFQAVMSVVNVSQYAMETIGPAHDSRIPAEQTRVALQIKLGQSIHLDAMATQLSADDRMHAQYTWDFDDYTPTSTYNVLPGFNACHVYDTVGGIHRIRLTIRTKDGTVSEAEQYVRVIANPRATVYVGRDDDETPASDDGSFDNPLSWTAGISRVRDFHRNQDVDVLFVAPSGNKKIFASDTRVNKANEVIPFAWEINDVVANNVTYRARNVRFGAYFPSGSSTRPEIVIPPTGLPKDADVGIAAFTLVRHWDQNYLDPYNDGVNQVRFENLRITYVDGDSGRSEGRGVYAYGTNVTIYNVSFENLRDPVYVSSDAHGDADPEHETNGLLVLNNDTGIDPAKAEPNPSPVHFYYGRGTNVVFLGNRMGDSEQAHNVRMYFNRVSLFYGNDIWNPRRNDVYRNYNTLRLNKGEFHWWAGNTLHGGGTIVGRDSSNSSEAQYEATHTVIERNRQLMESTEAYWDADGRWRVGSNASYVFLRNNYIESDDDQAIWVTDNAGYVEIFHNTAINNGPNGKGSFVETARTVEGSTRHHIFLGNNLYIAPLISSNSSGSAVRSGTTDQSEFSLVRGNRWAVPTNISLPFYVMTSQGTELRISLNEWKTRTSSDDVIPNPSIILAADGSYLPHSDVPDSAVNVAQIAGSGVAGDFYGNPRPAGNWTAGAVQRPFSTATAMFYGAYTSQDINTPQQTGSTLEHTAGSSYDVTAGGADIFGNADGFRFVHRKVSGDFDVKVQLADFSPNTHSAAKAGLMVRESLAAGSRHVLIAATPNASPSESAFKLVVRSTTNGSSDVVTLGSFTYPPGSWLRLRRSGNVFIAYYSIDGSNWVEMGRRTLSAFADSYVGMAVSSHSQSQMATAKFRNFSHQGGSFGQLTIQRGRGDDVISIVGNDTALTITTDGESIIYNNIGSLIVDADANDYTGDPSGYDMVSVNVMNVDVLVMTGPSTSQQADVLNITGGTYVFDTDARDHPQGRIALNISGSAVVTFNVTQHLDSLSISSGTATLASGGNKVLVTKELMMSGTGKLDLTDNDMIIQSGTLGSWNGTNYSGITRMIRAGRNGGAWNGNGILTSMTLALDPDLRTTLGIAEAANVVNFNGQSTALWNGETVSGTSILVKYTYIGDANLSGRITGADFSLIDAGYATRNDPSPLLGYYNGDFDYNGVIDATDYWYINRNHGYSQPPNPEL